LVFAALFLLVVGSVIEPRIHLLVGCPMSGKGVKAIKCFPLALVWQDVYSELGYCHFQRVWVVKQSLTDWDSWLGLKGEVLLLLYQVWFGRIILVSVDTVTFSESELDKQSLAGWRLFWMRLKGYFYCNGLVWY
jgi:hypothetical protein